MSLYLILNIASFIIPFLYSFEKKMQFSKRWKAFFPSLLISAAFFISWDIYFTKIGVWHFNPRYHTGIEIFGLPIEEWLFFFCIPYASLFIHFAFHYFLPKITISIKNVFRIYALIIVLVSPILILNWGKWYTTVNYSLLIILLTYTVINSPKILQTFFITFLIILIPFALVNGILTGSFIEQPVVYYNDLENLGFRLGTIPVEDIGYAFSMLLMTLVIMEKLENKEKKNEDSLVSR
ncbi:lycopene cyclase domain-containing protein [Flavobacterium sp. 7A]|uniref:lycopene cyclase domain-containing protein n=1 Tax=Flavobacterium sp. 7A TaxID=2940571 RepID=UPI00222635EF|nr:lycopene cyclase domain-containing protein [Flavobacterium sp. 7A]MCW2118973.1 lycopene cyclase domain-containing protein [Flavobacterium sp. 7A]